MLRSAVLCAIALFAAPVFGQSNCPGGQCPTSQNSRIFSNQYRARVPQPYPPRYSQPQVVAAPQVITSQVVKPSQPNATLSPISADDALGLTQSNSVPCETAAAGGGDPFEQVIRATVRVTVSGVCGSGTVVGRDNSGRALILTNAHVAGTAKGRVVNVERWDTNGRSEKSSAAIVASGYGRGMSLDFAVLRAAEGFAKSVKPVPMANRQPDTSALITTYGCPRCEWPSLQVLKMNRTEGQILSWHPEAIGGRSGSSVIDYTANGPEVIGLLTWGGGGEGLGQSMPFVLNAIQGRLPKSLEALPDYAKEVSTTDSAETVYVRAAWPTQDIEQGDENLLENITGGKNRQPDDNSPCEPDSDSGKGILRPNKPKQPCEPGTEDPDKGIFRNKPVIGDGSFLRAIFNFAMGAMVGAVAGFLFRGQISKWFSSPTS